MRASRVSPPQHRLGGGVYKGGVLTSLECRHRRHRLSCRKMNLKGAQTTRARPSTRGRLGRGGLAGASVAARSLVLTPGDASPTITFTPSLTTELAPRAWRMTARETVRASPIANGSDGVKVIVGSACRASRAKKCFETYDAPPRRSALVRGHVRCVYSERAVTVPSHRLSRLSC